MKIMYVNPQSYSNLSKYDQGFLSAVSSWDLHYVCSDMLDTEVQKSLNVYKVYSYNRRNNVAKKVISYCLSQVSLLRLISRVRPDVVHIQWVKWPMIDFLVLYLVKKWFGYPLIYTAHNVVPHNAEAGSHKCLGRIYGIVDRIVIHERDAQSEIIERFGVEKSKCRRIRHGAIPIIASGMPKYSAQVKEFLSDATFSFCFFGKGSNYKGIDILLAAWEEVCGRNDNSVRLLLIGLMDNIVRELLPGQRKNVMVIDDFVSEIDLFTAVRAANVLVFPYRKISQSGALLSILEFRRPIIVSDIAGLAELLHYGDIGWSFDGTSKDLAHVMNNLVSNPGVVRKKRQDERAWLDVQGAYAWNTMHEDIESLYKEFS